MPTDSFPKQGEIFPKPAKAESKKFLEQKIKNYRELLENLWKLSASVNGLGVEDREGYTARGYNQWTAYWDMRKDISKLKKALKSLPFGSLKYQEKEKELEEKNWKF